MDHLGGAILAGGIGLIIFVSVITIALSIFWIVELVDCARRQFDSDLVKVVWLCAVFFSHFIGAIAYYFAGKQMGRPPSGTSSTF